MQSAGPLQESAVPNRQINDFVTVVLSPLVSSLPISLEVNRHT